MTVSKYQIRPDLNLIVRPTSNDEFSLYVRSKGALISFIGRISADEFKSMTFRSRMAVVIGSTAVNHIKCRQKELLEQIETTLEDVVSDEYPSAKLDRDPNHTLLTLLDNTLQVILYSCDKEEEEEDRWFVKMASPDESPVGEPQVFEFSYWQFFEEDCDAFELSYQKAFQKDINLRSEEMHGLIGYWIDVADYGRYDKEGLEKVLAESEICEVTPETQ